MRYLPSFEDCLEICQSNPAFYYKLEEINNCEVYIFNYRLASYSDFKLPIPAKPHINAFELRGLTFVRDGNGQMKRYLMLQKFFNVLETEDNSLERLEKLMIVRVQEKLDGSMIRFIDVGGQIIAKTKFGLDNEQTRMAMDVYNSSLHIQGLVKISLEGGLALIFELISPMNKIVVDYPKTELKLIQQRFEDTGNYIYNNIADFGSLDYYMFLATEYKDFEGWVLTFADGTMAKLKTDWYKQMHRLVTEDLSRIDWIIRSTLDETIDDAIACIDDKNELKALVQDNVAIIRHKFNEMVLEVYQIIYNHETTNRKEFAIKYKEHKLFSVLMQLYSFVEGKQSFDENVLENALKTYIFRKINSLSEARVYAEKELGVKPLKVVNEE